MKKKLSVIMLFTTMLLGCNDNVEESVVFESTSEQESRQSILNNDIIFDKVKINNVHNFTIYFAHYMNGKEIKKYELILDENEKTKVNLDIIFSISNIANQVKTKTINFSDSGSVYYDTITFKTDDKYLKSLKVHNVNLSKDKKNILGGVYFDVDQNHSSEITINDLSKTEALLLIFEYNK